MNKAEKLDKFEKIVTSCMNVAGTREVLRMIGAPDYDDETISELTLYSDLLPMGEKDPYTEEQRYLHFLWEAIDKVPLGIDSEFAIWYRQIIAQKLFKKCGKGFIAHERCQFNFGHHIEVGDHVAWNSGALIDSKGGIKMGDHTMLAENVTIFTHAHSEANHLERIYKPVTLGAHVILGSGCKVLAGVTMGDGSFGAVGSVITHHVEAKTVVSGMPAKPLRETRTEGKSLDEVNHYFLKPDSFIK